MSGVLRAGLLALVIFTATPTARAQQTPAPTMATCAPDGAIMLLQDFQTFDMTGRGWRRVAREPGCELQAADLIAKFRDFQKAMLGVDEVRILRLREGQIRAQQGQTPQAITLLTDAEDPADTTGLNPYVDATVAFLKRDRAALTAARDRLAATPKPADFEAMAAEYEHHTGRRPQWPPNADAVAAMITCFDRTYREAMTDPVCRTAP